MQTTNKFKIWNFNWTIFFFKSDFCLCILLLYRQNPTQQLLWPHCIFHDRWIPTGFPVFLFLLRIRVFKVNGIGSLFRNIPSFQNSKFYNVLPFFLCLHWLTLNLISFVLLGLTLLHIKIGFSKTYFLWKSQKTKLSIGE